jgi:hypothetical protein
LHGVDADPSAVCPIAEFRDDRLVRLLAHLGLRVARALGRAPIDQRETRRAAASEDGCTDQNSNPRQPV